MINPFKVHMPVTIQGPLMEVLESGYVGQGPKVDLFEQKLSEKFGLKNVVTVNSGTSALRLCLALAGVGLGDEVISTPYTMVATNTAILEQHAEPVFADVQFNTVNIDPEDIEHRITNKTKAIMCVHWGGYPCDMDKIHKIAKKHNLVVIEDAAQALGVQYKGNMVGTMSDFTAFSFQAIKHLTTVDGGMITTKDSDKFKEAQRRRWFGIDRNNRRTDPTIDPIIDITELGFKYHMNDVNATIGIEQIPDFDKNFDRRFEIAKQYREAFKDIEQIGLLESRDDVISGNWMFAIHVPDRKDFIEHMHQKGVGVTIHNWRNDSYSIFGGKRDDLPNLDKLNESLVCIPIHQGLSDDDVNLVIDEVKNYYSKD